MVISAAHESLFTHMTHRRRAGWPAVMESENYRPLNDGWHRCKGGAPLPRLERIVALIDSRKDGTLPRMPTLASKGNKKKLTAADQAVSSVAG